jgi:acetyltransferase-like isoleucine patch superfamily enzyme
MSVQMREALKSVLFGVATIAVTPALLSFWIRAAFQGRDRALEGSSQALSLVPGFVGVYLRRAFFARTLEVCHPTVTIEFGVLLSKSGARLDERVYIGPRCHLGLVHLGRDVLLGPAVQIPSGAETHGTADAARPIREQAGVRTLITIGDGSWIGAGAIVMADVGPDSVIGAGAVVTEAIPGRVLAAGVPARVIKPRT